MNFSISIATINLNSSNNDIHKSLLRDFVHSYDVDLVFLQEVMFENFNFLSSHNALINISADKKGTGVLIRKKFSYSSPIFDPSGRILSLVVNGINFINVYAHSGSNKKRQRDDLFANQMAVHLSRSDCKFSVLIGDFNCILNPTDSNSSVKNYSKGLRSLVDAFKFKDIAQALKCDKFTFYRGDSTSRLDRVYGPQEFLNDVREVKTIAVAFSDHHALFLKYSVRQQDIVPRGRSYWKIDPLMLSSAETCDRLKVEYAHLKHRLSYMDLSSWWNHAVKAKLRSFYKRESWQAGMDFRNQKSSLYCKLEKLSARQASGENLCNEIGRVKSELMELENMRLERLRCRINDCSLIEGEKINVCQVSKYLHSNTPGLLSETATDNPNNTPLLEQIHHHFKNLFKEALPDDNPGDSDPLENITKSLSLDEANSLIRPITEEEISNTLKACSKKKSPGPDGLSFEFYTKNFDIVKDDLVALFNSYLTGNSVPPKDFTAGIITLIPKKGCGRTIDDFRPISLLNTDYKLFTKIIASRIMTILDKLLEYGQCAAVNGRSCTDNVKDLRRLITRSVESKKFKGFLVSLDLKKAFDNVDHNYLWTILEKFKFPVQLINCLKKLYSSASSKVLHNGFLTPEIPIRSSVRQGCPLSMVLFVLYVEPLIRSIHASSSGVLVYRKFLKVIAYADDITVFVRSQKEFDDLMVIVSAYSKYAKISINKEKSCFLRINNAVSGPQLIQEVDEVTILGVTICRTWSKMIDVNYIRLIKSLQQRLIINESRNLNLIQRSWILNTFILSKLWYVAQVFPPRNSHLAKIKSLVGRFLWKTSIFRIARDQLYLPFHKGGINLVDPESKCKALFIRNVIKENDDGVEDEEYLLKYPQKGQLTRNAKEWLEMAEEVKGNSWSDSTKLLYDFFLSKLNIIVSCEMKHPEVDWVIMWSNWSKNFINSEDKSNIYLLLNDAVPNKEKLYAYGIGRLPDKNCCICGVPDNNLHKIFECAKGRNIRDWVSQIIRSRLKIDFRRLDDLLVWNIKNEPRQNAALWLAVHCISWIVNPVNSDSLYIFQKSIREQRWSNRKLFSNHFGSHLNIC